MLRPIQVGLARPVSINVNPNATFQPGMISQLQAIGNDIVMGVSDGLAPIGIIDDIKTTAFTTARVDEIVDIEIPVAFDGYNFVSTMTVSKELENASIVPNSFRADYPGLILNQVNGVLRAPAGSIANFKVNGSTTFNAIRTIVNYSFYIPNIAGEDSTLGSGKITVWFARGIYQTDQFESVPFALNATLFVSGAGKLTTEQVSPSHPAVAICTLPPSAQNATLEFLWI